MICTSIFFIFQRLFLTAAQRYNLFSHLQTFLKVFLTFYFSLNCFKNDWSHLTASFLTRRKSTTLFYISKLFSKFFQLFLAAFQTVCLIRPPLS
jgi:hypothetical protein